MLASRVALVAALIVVWQLVCSLGLVSSLVLSSPAEVAEQAWRLIENGALPQAFADTAQGWLLALGIALVLGNAIGLIIGSNRFIAESTRFVIDFLRSVPAVTLIPLALLLYGASLQMKLVIIVFGATWDVLVQAVYASRQVDPVARDTFAAFSVSRWHRFWHLRLPSAAPFLATGVRIAAIHALLLSIGAELVGGAAGVGQQLAVAEQSGGDLSSTYVYMIAAGLAGVLLNQLLLAAEKKLLLGHPGYRQ